MPSSNDAAELQSLFEGADAAREEAELTWGSERLPIIVGHEWRTKLRRQQRRMAEALQAAWAADSVTGPQMQAARDACAGMERAWGKLPEVAAEAGHRPLSAAVLAESVLRDGSVAIIVRDNDAAAQVLAEGRQCAVYTFAELFNLIGELIPDSLALAKVHFPGARFEGPKFEGGSEWDVKQGDEVPF